MYSIFAETSSVEDSNNFLPLLLWPFLLIGIWEFVVSIGFLAQGKQKIAVFMIQNRKPRLKLC